jgi:excisionase family DNA binding protein
MPAQLEADDDVIADGLRTIQEGHEFTRLSRATLYGMMERGELEYVKLGRRRLIPFRALVALARRGLVAREQ